MIRLVRFAIRQRAHSPNCSRLLAKNRSTTGMPAQLQPVGTFTQGFLCTHTQVRLLPRRNCSQTHARAFHPIQRSSGNYSSRRNKQSRVRHVLCHGVQTDDKAAQTQTLPQLPALDGEYCITCSAYQSHRNPEETYHRLSCLAAGTYQENTKFAPYANWLIPGHLMVGRYPYVEPSRCP